MADADTKGASAEDREGRLSVNDPVETFELGDDQAGVRPGGWKYKERRIFGLTIPWYASPKAQLLLVSFVCFLCPGMFNALGGLGGGGKQDPTLADNMVRPAPMSFQALLCDSLDLTRCAIRTSRSTALSPSSASSPAPSSTNWV